MDLEKAWKGLREGTCEDLKKHVKLDNYKNVKYGIAVGFFYDPADVLAGEKSSLGIKIEVYTRDEIEKLEVEK